MCVGHNYTAFAPGFLIPFISAFRIGYPSSLNGKPKIDQRKSIFELSHEQFEKTATNPQGPGAGSPTPERAYQRHILLLIL